VSFGQLERKMYESALAEIRNQLAIFPFINMDKITTDIKTGPPYEEIFKEVEERDIDLIIIDSLGSKGLEKYRMGDVAHHMLLGAKCSVFLVK
jgi:nucleotide-binding universal stress UspA family protein